LRQLLTQPMDSERSSAPSGGGILGRFDHVREKPSMKKIVACSAATPEYARSDFLKPCHLPVEVVDRVANYAPSCDINETRFHKGFARRHRSDIQPDAARLEREFANECAREERAQAAIQATRDYKERVTFNVLTGEGVGRECEFPQTGKRIVNPQGNMHATYAEHGRDATNRMRNSRHRYFEPVAAPASTHRTMTLLNEGLTETQRQNTILGYGNAMKRRTRTQSCGAADNYAHLRELPPEPAWEPPRFSNESRIVLG